MSAQAEVEGGGWKGALGPQDTQDAGKSAAHSQENKLFFFFLRFTVGGTFLEAIWQ